MKGLHSYCCSCDIEKQTLCRVASPLSERLRWLPPLMEGLHSYCCSCDIENENHAGVASPLSARGVVVSPDEGTALLLLQLRYRKTNIMQVLLPSQCKGGQSQSPRWLSLLMKGLHSYCCSCYIEKQTLCRSCFPSQYKGKSLSKTKVVVSPDEGTALVLLQLRYRKTNIMQELLPLSAREVTLKDLRGCFP